MRFFSAVLLSSIFSISVWGGDNIPKCDSVVFEYLTDIATIDSTSGIAVVPVNKFGDSPEDDITLWDVRTGKLIKSVRLLNRQPESAINILGFEDANTILILTWDQSSAYSGPSLIEYKIKEQKEILRWSNFDKGFKVFDFSVPAKMALVGVGMYPYDYKILDLNEGSLLPLKDIAVAESERLAFSPDGRQLFGGKTKSESADWHSFSLDFTQWNFANLDKSIPAVSFSAEDFNIATNVNRHQDSILGLQTGADEKSLYISSQIETSNHVVQNFLSYVDLKSSKKTTCSYSVKGRINFEVVNLNKNILLVSDSMWGNYHPVFMDAKTCQITSLPTMAGFTQEQYPPKLKAAQVNGRSVLFNYQNIWDAETGKVLLKMCQ